MCKGWGAKARTGSRAGTILTSDPEPASPRVNTLSKEQRVGFFGCRLEPGSPVDKQLPLNPILKARLGSS